MAIQSVQLNTNNTDLQQPRAVKPYREAEGIVRTKRKVKPLPPKGHLVDDNLATGTKYFFKDIGYDMKSVKNGFYGTANDHQLGRLNDVGLRLGGIGIATYLASITTNPKARLMEYVGLAAFLTSMALYPKIAINAPARIVHGYDIDKQYIDDQGRKKSVHQDSNYIPYDMYNGANKGEDLDAIGDRMGIPRDIKNRHDVIREQMRKIATQNNTLWMLTAGFATPVMTALLCSGIEKYIVSPGLEKSRNTKYNAQIQAMLKEATAMDNNVSNIKNSLGESVKNILSKYEGKTISAEAVEEIKSLLTANTDDILAEGIKTDIDELLSSNKLIKLDKKSLKNIIETSQKSIGGRQSNFVIENIIPSQEEIEAVIKLIKPDSDITKGIELTEEEFVSLKSEISDLANKKIEATTGVAAKHKSYLKQELGNYVNAFTAEPVSSITKETIEKTSDFAKVIGDFAKKAEILDKCENFKFEYAPETVLANYYEKFQTTLVKQLGISPKDYKRMSNDKAFAQKILDEKMTELCKNENKYRETFEKLGKIFEQMETALHGSTESSQIKDLINGIELVYGKTSERLTALGIGKETAKSLMKGTTSEITSNEDLRDILDGIAENKFRHSGGSDIEALKYYSNGKGSSKNIRISRLINRYQGEANSFFRVLHTLDFYKRAANPNELMQYSSANDSNYVENIIKQVKLAMTQGTDPDFTMKNGIENPHEYKDFYNIGWSTEYENFGSTKQKGIVTDTAKEGLEKSKINGRRSIFERLQYYISRFKNVVANDRTYFVKPEHILDDGIRNIYRDIDLTSESKFNLVAQNPVDMLQKAASKMHADRKWIKSVGILGGSVLGVTLLAQFGFGKLKNKQNLQKIDKSEKKQKQVKNEVSK
ncbi:MAG: hypothetical protein MJ230_04105 [bacterium]|nr:hypothetical protein [bacterium]